MNNLKTKVNVLDQLETAYSMIDTQIKTLEKTKVELKKQVLSELEKEFGHQGVTYSNTLTGEKIQRIIQVRTSLDNEKIKKILAPDVWKRVTEEKIVSKLFFAAIEMGIIKSTEIKEAVETSEVDKLEVIRR